jgi:hypothetical protein
LLYGAALLESGDLEGGGAHLLAARAIEPTDVDVLFGVCSYYWVLFARQIDARLHGERDRVLPRVYARPFELYRGQALGVRQLVDRLNDLGYAERARREARRVRAGTRRHRAHPARRGSQGRDRPRDVRPAAGGAKVRRRRRCRRR